MSKHTTSVGEWTNYETWCVSLWIDGAEPAYRFWRDEIQRHRREALQCDEVIEGKWTVDEAARLRLADQLQHSLANDSWDDEPRASSEFVETVLEAVNWHELAKHLSEDESADDRSARPLSESQQIVTVRPFERQPDERAHDVSKHIGRVTGDVPVTTDFDVCHGLALSSVNTESKPDLPDTEGLGYHSFGRGTTSYVDSVNGAGAAACREFQATRHELQVLAGYWYRELTYVDLYWFEYQTAGSAEWRTAEYADRRIARIRGQIGDTLVDKAIAEVDAEFRELLGDDEWQLFEDER